MSAVCATGVVDPEVFFPETPEQYDRARAACGTCPCRTGCLAEAVDAGVTDGVWGGVLFERGRVVSVKRRPGRPGRVVS